MPIAMRSRIKCGFLPAAHVCNTGEVAPPSLARPGVPHHPPSRLPNHGERRRQRPAGDQPASDRIGNSTRVSSSSGATICGSLR